MSIRGIYTKLSNWIKNRKNVRKLTVEKCLFEMGEHNYGSNYKHDLLAQYKLYVELTDRIDKKIHRSNFHFVSINLICMVALGGIMADGNS